MRRALRGAGHDAHLPDRGGDPRGRVLGRGGGGGGVAGDDAGGRQFLRAAPHHPPGRPRQGAGQARQAVLTRLSAPVHAKAAVMRHITPVLIVHRCTPETQSEMYIS